MVSMLLGRPLSAIAGIFVLILLSRVLSPEDYGSYFAAWAITEILILASNTGVIHATYRYVSASETADGVTRPEGPIWSLLGWRVFSLILVVVGIHFLSLDAGRLFGLPSLSQAQVSMLGIIILSEGLARFIETVFDSMLCQGLSQITLISRTLFRLLGIAIFLDYGDVEFGDILVIEACATSVGALLGLVLLARLHFLAINAKTQKLSSPGIRRLLRFALPAYAAQILVLTYGPDALKLIVGGTGGSAVLATFGFSFALAAVVQRYMPVNLMAGIFRPIFVVASKRDDRSAVLSALTSLLVKINWLFVFPVLIASAFGGEIILSAISAGAYPESGVVTTLIVAAFAAVSMHLTLSMYCLAQENSWPPFVATALAVIGLPMGVYAADNFGAIGVALSYGIVELIWTLVCYCVVRFGYGELKFIDFVGLSKFLFALLAAMMAGLIFGKSSGVSPMVLSVICPLSFFFLIVIFKPFSAEEKGWLISVLPLSLTRIMLRIV